MQTALIVIDVQESFRQRPYFSNADVNEYLIHQNALIEGSKQRGIPIVRVFHVEGEKVPSNAFALESGHIRPLQGLAEFDAALAVHKSRHSALVGTGLEVWLTQQGIQKLIISGIRTEQCCETTARHASDLGWKIDYVTDATLTFNMQNADGSTLSAADIKVRTATVLKDRFARVCSVKEALDALHK